MRGQTHRKTLDQGRQRELRRNMTDAERLLWRHLRGCQLAGAKFRRQHPYYGCILDFVCLEHRLVIELDGGQHADRTEQDLRRDAFLAQGGFRVLRFWNTQVMQETEAVLAAVLDKLMACRQHHPHPSPPLEGEGADLAGRASPAPIRG